MAVSKIQKVTILCGAGMGFVVVCLVLALILSGSLELVGKSSGEIAQIVEHLDSTDSLKTILVTYSSQYQQAEAHWLSVLNRILMLLFVVSMLALGLLVALMVQLHRGEGLRQQVRRLKQGA
ncbi:hypothetical protein [Motiliproteus sp. SC1-56]|uniref:hypothetical protein n=1 Tax=Motiliproteus sp. SC1-56 TaxID=2799565 RepID=UPI001A8C8EE6|nr:hypothetical protein [Motiliproteus sp. SC1-56]